MTLTGVYVPLITPFDAAGSIAVDALTSLAHDILAAGARGLVALGTTAEPASLTPTERATVVDTLAAVCTTRRAPLIVAANTAPDVRALRDTPAATAAMCVVPPFVRPGEAGVIAHLTAVAAASPVPLIVYHVPHRTGQHLSAAAIRRLAAVDQIAGIKYATGTLDAEYAVDLLADPPDNFAILGGDDTVISPLLALGAPGGILAAAHLATRRFVDLADAWHTGDTARARRLGHTLAPLTAALFAGPNPTVIKAVLHAHGRIPTADVRLPLLPATADTARPALRAAAPS